MTSTVKRITLGAVAGLLSLGLGAGAFVHAQDQTPDRQGRRGGPGGPGRFGGPGGGPMGMLPMLGRDLNLTDAQRDQVKSVMQSHRNDLKTLGDRTFEAHRALEAVISADTIDEAAIRARSADLATVEADMAVMRAQVRAEVWQILTPEQQQQARTLQAEMQQRMEQGRQQHQGKQKQSGAAK